jgi:hypothetical protein
LYRWAGGLMGWARKSRRFGGALALLALVFQIVLSLSHVHPPGPGSTGEMILAAQPETAAVHHDGPTPRANVSCDLCAILHMAAIGQGAALPLLILPAAFAAAAPAVLVDLALTPSRQVLPQSRAPPIV